MGKPRGSPPQTKINVTSKSPVGDISVVTLIRTDTTLDHSQKAEKVCSTYARRTHSSSEVQSAWFSCRGARPAAAAAAPPHIHVISRRRAPMGPVYPNQSWDWSGHGNSPPHPRPQGKPQIHAKNYTKHKRRLELRCLSATEVTASCSGL